MEAVGELDQDDALVLRHREHHLAVVLGLRLLAALEVDPRQLRDALDELADLVADLGAHVLDGRLRVLDDVVEKRGGERGIVRVQLGEDARDAQRMLDEVLAATPVLALVRVAREDVGAEDQVAVDVRVVRRDLVEQLLQLVPVALGSVRLDGLAHELSVAPALPVKRLNPVYAAAASCSESAARKVGDSARLLRPPGSSTSPSSSKICRACGVQLSAPALHSAARLARSSS